MGISDRERRRLQLHCLDIVREIDRVCTENGIAYSLCGGTMIGSKVCQGFLPWDDDADIMMDRPNYDRFIQVFPQKCQSHFQLAHHSMCENFHVLYAKVEDTRYQLVEEALGGELTKNVFVDVAVLDGVSGPLQERWLRLRGTYVSQYLYRRNGQQPNHWLFRVLGRLVAPPRSSEGEHKLFARYEEACRRSCQKPAYLTELMVPLWRKERYAANLFDAYRQMPFEGESLMNIQDLDSYFLSAFNKTQNQFALDAENQASHWSHCLRLLDGEGEGGTEN